MQPQLATCTKALRSFLLSPAKHRFLLYAGHAFKGSGEWILQDDCFTYEKFAQVCKESDVENALKQSEGGGTLTLFTFAEGPWNNNTISKLNIGKILDVKINPAKKLEDSKGIERFTAYLSYFLKPQPPKSLLQASDVVGNIRFTCPTLYIFPGCQGDAALLGISGFNLLINAGFSRNACFWDFARHLDRIDAFVLTHLSANNIFGASSFLERKAQDNVHPEIGYVYMNVCDKVGNIPNGDSDGSNQSLLVSLIDEGNKMVANLKSIGQSPHPCVGQLKGQELLPLTLYHKVGHGTLEMYVLNPLQDSKEMKEFLSQWSKQVDNFTSTKSKVGGKEVGIPLPNAVSVSALLVWTPSDPSENFTRILLPGNAPQSKLFEGLDKLKAMGMFQHETCCQNNLNAPSKPGAGKAKPPAGKAAASRPAATKAAPPPATKTERKPAAERKPPSTTRTTPAKTSKDEKNKKAAAGKDKKSPTVSSPSSSASRTPPPAHSTPEPSPASGEAKITPPLLTPELEKEVAIKDAGKDIAAAAKEVAVKAEPPPPAEPLLSPALDKSAALVDDSLLKEESALTDTSSVTNQSSFAFEPDMSQQSEPAADQSIESPEPLPDPGQVKAAEVDLSQIEAKAQELAESPAKQPELNGHAYSEEGPLSPPPSPVDQIVMPEKADDVESAPEVAAPVEPVAAPQEEAKSPVDLDQADTAPISSPESEPSQVDALPAEPAAAVIGSAGEQDLVDLGIYSDDMQPANEVPVADLSRSQHEEVLKASQMTSSIYEPSDPVEAGAADVSDPEALQDTQTAIPSEEQLNAPEVDQVFGGASPEGLPEPVTPEMDMSPQGHVEIADPNEALMMTKNPFMSNEEQPLIEGMTSEEPVPEQLREEEIPEQSPVEVQAPEQLPEVPAAEEKVSEEQMPAEPSIVDPEPVMPVQEDKVSEQPESEQPVADEVPSDSVNAEPEAEQAPAPLETAEVPASPIKADAPVQEIPDVPESPEQVRSPEEADLLAQMSPEIPTKDLPVDDSLEQLRDVDIQQPEEPKKQRSLSPEEQRDSSQEPADSLTGSYSEEQVYRTSRPDEVAPLVEEEGYDDFYGMESAHFMQNQDQAAQQQNPFNLVDSPMECGIAQPDQSVNPFLGVQGGEGAPQMDNNLFGIPAAAANGGEVISQVAGQVSDQTDPFSHPELQQKLIGDDKEEDISRDSLERDFDPLKSWGQPMGLPAPPPPNPVAADKKPTAKRSTGPASKKPAEAKKAAASATSRSSLGTRTIVKKDPKKDETEKKDATENKRASSTTKTTTTTSRLTGPARKPAAAKPATDKLNGSMSKEAPKKTATKTRPATAPASTKAKVGAATAAAASRGRPATASSRAETPTKAAPLTPVVPFYVELAYVPCHGDPQYSDLDFFRRVRAKFYVVSALNPSSSVFNALLEAKQTWDKPDLEVTIIPTYDTETLRQWMGLHREQLSNLKIQVAASANRCTIQLQDHETSCSAYRLQF